jgi:hypothetical protein
MREKEFYEKIVLDSNANIRTKIVEKTGDATKCKSKFDFFNRVKLDENNNLKIVFE